MKKSNMTGKQIKSLRNYFGLTQKQCAERIEVGTRMWQKYEEGAPIKQLYLDCVFRPENHSYETIVKALGIIEHAELKA